MAWNIGNKDLGGFEKKAGNIGPGAPVAYNPSMAGRPYKDSWDIERAYREGVQKVTWVNRCIDAIAGNQARLPMIIRKDNSPDGEIVRKKNPILDILNSTANQGENSFIFRYRLSSQLLMSSRGAFIEKVRGRNGEVVALHLLPPQHTSPIPDPKRFVSGFEVDMRNGTKIILRPEDVIWVRRPHPLDPYLSMTPMEAAGIAIEIENLAKIYNRNFLLNDGRPGGLIVVRGEIDDDDKDELRSRFRGNLSKTGAVTVLSSDEGVDFVDTGASPRDAAYIQMRQITKEEILSAFGVPESVIGNAAGRTFSNAGEEIRVFWVETMMPHLMQMARALDALDPEYYIDFDTSQVPVLVLYKQERERYLLDELQAGLISPNEYRAGTGKKEIDSDLMNAMLANPNLTPIGYTDKPFDSTQQQQLDMMGAQQGAPGAPQMPGMPPMPGAVLGQESGMIGAPEAPQEGMTAALAQEAQVIPTEVGPVQGLSENLNELRFKSMNAAIDEWDTKAEQDSDRWVEIMDRSLERLFDRQNRVVIEKANGAKAKKSLESGKLEGSAIFDTDVWNKQLQEDLRPVIKAIIEDSARLASQKTGMPVEIDEEELNEYIEQQLNRAQQVNNTTKEEILAAILIAQSLQDDEDRSGMLKAALAAIFLNLLTKRRRLIAEHESQSAYNAGTYFASRLLGSPTKTWVTRKDAKVRAEHLLMQGKTVDVGQSFDVDGVKMRFPGDPSAPVHLTINCRCRLKFDTL
jgi:HK97 family phage portal protein